MEEQVVEVEGVEYRVVVVPELHGPMSAFVRARGLIVVEDTGSTEANVAIAVRHVLSLAERNLSFC